MPSLSEMLSPEDLEKLKSSYASSMPNQDVTKFLPEASGQEMVPYSQLAKSPSSILPAENAGMNLGKAAIGGEANTIALDSAGVGGEVAGGSLLESAGRLASRAAIPLTAAYEFLKSGNMGGEKEAYADEHPSGPMFTQPKEDKLKPFEGPSEAGVKDTALGSKDDIFKAVSNQIQEQEKKGNVGPEETEEAPATTTSPEKQKILDVVNKLKSAQPRMNTGDAIAALLGLQQNKLQSAQDAANSGRLIAMLGQAGSTIGHALTPMSKEKPDTEFFKNLEQTAGQPVQDVIQQQQSQQSTVKGSLEREQLKKAMNLQDASSDESKSFRKAVETAYPNIKKVYGADWDNVSAADKDLVFEPIKLKEQMDAKREATANALEMKKLTFGKQSSDKENTATNQTISMLESAKGNPEVSLALRNKLLVKNAASLINQYPDPNMMSPQEVSLLVTEIGKIASGGVPAEKELQSIMPGTMKSTLASSYSKLTNEPSPAAAGAFIKRYKSYLQELDKNSTDVINEKFDRVLKGKKKSIGDENFNVLRSQYGSKPLEFNSSAKTSEFPSDVMKYASDHGITPEQAAAIKAQRSGE